MPIRSNELNGANWRKSTFTNAGGDAQCVELAHLTTGGAVRDSKETSTAILLPTTAFHSFLTAARTGHLDA